MNDSNGYDARMPETIETGFSPVQIPAAVFSDGKTGAAIENSEETIRRVLSSYEIGTKLRQLRLRKKIALVDLGRHTGLSASMLSQLENGRLLPTLPTLARIAMVFDVGMDYFFGDRSRRKPFSIIRKADRIRFPDRPDNPTPNYFFECLAYSSTEKAVQAYTAEIPMRRAEEISEHTHDGWEFFHVLEGSVQIRYSNEDHVLREGDSVYFEATEPHSYRGLTSPAARVIVVTASQPF